MLLEGRLRRGIQLHVRLGGGDSGGHDVDARGRAGVSKEIEAESEAAFEMESQRGGLR